MPVVKFPLGRVVATPGFLAIPNARMHALQLLQRHRAGDWGEVDAHDKAQNNASVTGGTRILSAYTVEGTSVWIITEADRSATTLLLPEEY